jgi:hypothetical protein
MEALAAAAHVDTDHGGDEHGRPLAGVSDWLSKITSWMSYPIWWRRWSSRQS